MHVLMMKPWLFGAAFIGAIAATYALQVTF